MAITLRSGKKCVDFKEVETDKVETEKEEARLKKKEEKKEEYKFTPGNMLFPDNSSLTTPIFTISIEIQKGQRIWVIYKISKYVQKARSEYTIRGSFGSNVELCEVHEGNYEQQEEVGYLWNNEPFRKL